MLSNFDAIARDRFKSLFLLIALRSVNTIQSSYKIDAAIGKCDVCPIDDHLGFTNAASSNNGHTDYHSS